MDTCDISVEVEGTTYPGLYWVDAGIVTVTTGLATKRSELGSAPAEAVARMLLKEIAQEEKQRTAGS